MERIGTRLLNWASVLDEATLAQARATASLPIVHPHVALMPDAHLGKGATVGSVIPTREAIIPAAVGVDIGCGMIAVRSQFTVDDARRRDLALLRRAIEARVPLSAGNANRTLTDTARPRIDELTKLADEAGFEPARDAARWELQLGTLGSGNHFIEVTTDEAGRVWLFLHSGSRGVGNRIAQRHIAVARQLCERNATTLPHRDLAYLTEDTEEFWTYIRELRWAQHYALLNREEMMDRVVDCLSEHVGTPVERIETINCHHNYTERERHYGEDVWLSRKGAIHAGPGVPGLIPGSMGTASYVVDGKGNAESLHSSPHGAGRSHSRTAARRTFTRAQLDAAMRGIEWRRTDAFLDEIPAAYKDIDIVMRDADDLVSIRHTLRQIVNVKGD